MLFFQICILGKAHATRGENAGNQSKYLTDLNQAKWQGPCLPSLMVGPESILLTLLPGFVRNEAAGPVRFHSDSESKQAGHLGEAPAEQQFHVLGRDIELFAHELPEMFLKCKQPEDFLNVFSIASG